MSCDHCNIYMFRDRDYIKKKKKNGSISIIQYSVYQYFSPEALKHHWGKKRSVTSLCTIQHELFLDH